MNFDCKELVAATTDTAQTGRVFAIELSGHADPRELNAAYEAIMFIGEDRTVQIVVDIANLYTRTSTKAMLQTAAAELPGRLTVTGTEAPLTLLSRA